MADEQLCPCGRPLHYTNAEIQSQIERLIAECGETMEVRVLGSERVYLVPRHWIALHGLKAAEIPQLAERYGWDSFGGDNHSFPVKV